MHERLGDIGSKEQKRFKSSTFGRAECSNGSEGTDEVDVQPAIGTEGSNTTTNVPGIATNKTSEPQLIENIPNIEQKTGQQQRRKKVPRLTTTHENEVKAIT